VLNNTRVFPARLIGRRLPGGSAVECMLIEQIDNERWEALMHPGQRLKPGVLVVFGNPEPVLQGEILERRFHGRRLIRLWRPDEGPVMEAVEEIGRMPLPPYIKRQDESADRERYQTVYARIRGSIAAPTAGLHFTETLLAAVRARGVEIVEITLHVGYGTFKPVRTSRVEDHEMDAETFEISPKAASDLNRAWRNAGVLLPLGPRVCAHSSRLPSPAAAGFSRGGR
jgi:S-adenosylmethionine:tRNA ribosyltransferase-isomerase